jgi:hypothetical protein
MRLATIRTAAGTRAVRLDDERAVETGHSDLGVLLGETNWREQAAAALVRAYDDIVLPSASDAVDWEAELAVVIGAPARHDANRARAGHGRRSRKRARPAVRSRRRGRADGEYRRPGVRRYRDDGVRVDDPHSATRRRHRTGHPGRRGPCPQATALPAAGTDPHHIDRGPRTVPERLCRREVITPW